MTNDGNYQDTFCDWVGEIPKDWNMTRGRFLFNSKKEINRELQCENLLSLTLNGVLNKDYQSSEGLRPENYNTYQIFQKDDLVFKMIDLENIKTSRVGLVHEEGIMSPVYIRHEPIREKINPKFAYWFYYDLYKKEIYNSIGSGVRSSLSSSDLLEIELPVPPIEEQKLISQYLDKKTSQIDSLVEKIQKKIELLKEQRTSLINHYVTKGLEPNVEMKDSGIEWIGEIPRHWKILRLCNFGLFSKGKNITKGDLVETGKPVILYSHLYTTYSRTVKEPKFFISDDLEENSTKIFKNTFLFTSSGESKEDIGKCILYLGNETSVGGDQVIFKLKSTCNFDPEFLSFSFNSDFCLNQKSSNSRGEIVVHIYEKQLRDVVVPIPPENEQISIRNKLQEVERNSDEIIRNLKHKIELLKEYRQSLISSVVTGKVRVTEDMI